MLLPHKVKQILFDNYKEFIGFSKKKFANLEYQGLCHEELVNESIIAVLDVKTGFEDKETVIKYVKKSIETVGYHERELLKDFKFILQKAQFKENEKAVIEIDRPKPIDAPTDEFIRVYELFEKQRFGTDNEKMICNNCAGTSFYNCSNSRFKCKICGYILSVTSGTYLSNMNLSLSKMYKLLTWICKPYKTSSYFLAKLCDLSQKTTWYRRKLILSVILNNEQYNVDEILDRLLTPKKHDNNPIVLMNTSTRNRKFDINDIYNMRRLYTEKIYNTVEIAKIYDTDASSVRKIGKKLLYKSF